MTKKTPRLNYELVVIGAGPAGMSAAVEAANHRLDVAVFDMQPAPGGQIYRNLEGNSAYQSNLTGILGSSYFDGAPLISEFRSAKIDYFPRSTVWHLRADGAVGVTVNEACHLIRAKYVLVASGAMERPAPFPGWTLPGVMGAGAAQTLIKASHAIPSGPTAIAGTGPLAILVAYQLMKMGLDLRGLLLTSNFSMRPGKSVALLQAWPEIREVFKGLKWLGALSRHVPIYTGVDNLVASGEDRIENVTFQSRGKNHTLSVGTLLVHDGIVPLFELMADAGCQLDWFSGETYWMPHTNAWGQTTCARIFAAGDAQGVGGAKAARIRGALSALEIARLANQLSQDRRDFQAKRLRHQLKKFLSLRPLMRAQFPEGLSATLLPPETIVCRCEEITSKTILDAHRAGATTINQMKALTRCGMGPCQGKMCAPTATRVLSSVDQIPIEEIQSYRARFPGRPLSLGQLAQMNVSPEFLQNAKIDQEIDKPQLTGTAQ
ncbi:FAD-dependent oxidoreductase [Hoeflea prorocentri]|uniref:FAD-dependent oxidoreductase n=1 Tax=Hoeflea prorocentri TaxID=1922333 RepID=A0A9X3UDM5_9HYPH|nr:FAD-dependent oxidoreductase [Hoeflea prorocentri]MCY6379366.1 FAD-dependent oxidoreductase [Hoeflea prorocentri]MDA5397167.1 FAD-dependent oxidoreductase [Hoeflea prorocentri]